MKSNKVKYFFYTISLYTFVYALLFYFLNALVFTDTFYLNSLSNQFTFERIQIFLKANRIVNLVNYCIIPFVIIIKVFITGAILYVGTILLDLKTELNTLVQGALYAEIVFLVQAIIKFAYILILGPDSETISKMNVLFSVNYLIGCYKHFNYFNYCLNTLNLFEIGYVFLLISYIIRKTSITFKDAALLVTKTYIIGLFIWILFVTFLSLQFS